MKFLKLELNNFKSFKGKHAFDFMQTKPGFYFITGETDEKNGAKLGSNGAGKSTFITDAPFWILFGKTPRSLKAANVHTWGAKGPTEGALTLEINDIVYTVFRSWSPNKLQLTKDGNTEEVSQETVDNLINLNETELSNSVMFSQFGQTFLDLQPSQMMELFSASLDLDIWTEKSDKTKKLLTDTVNYISKLDTNIQVHNSRIESTLQEILTHKGMAEVFEENKQNRLTTLNDKLSVFKIERQSLFSEKQELEQKLLPINMNSIKNKIEINTEKGRQIGNKANTLRSSGSLINDKINSIKTEIRIKEKELEKIQGMEDFCSACGQPITEEHFISEQQRVIDELSILEGKLPELNTNLTKVTEEYNSLNDELVALTEEKNELYKLQVQESSKNTITESSIRNKDALLRDKQQEINTVSNEITAVNNSKNTSEALALQRSADLSNLQKECNILKDKLIQLNKDKIAYETWVKGFKEIRLLVIEDAISELEVEVNNNLIELGLDGWKITFDVERENKSGNLSKGFAVQIYSPHNKEVVPLAAWSGGEGQRLRIAAVSGLANFITNRKGVFPNIEVWDEPTKGLSGEGVDYLLAFLSNRTKVLNKQIYLIDHNSLDSGEFDRTITINKNSSGSIIK